jgi:hypothetical protein
MKIVIDINRDKVIETLKNGLVNLVFLVYSWFINEGEILGYILAVFHILICATVFVFIILCHTIYPVFWLQVVVFIFLFFIWLQHITLKVCVLILAEKELTQNISPYSELIKELLKMYNIRVDQFITYFMITETVGVGCFALELISRISVYAQRYFIKNSI